jgi:hypothetical protein
VLIDEMNKRMAEGSGGNFRSGLGSKMEFGAAQCGGTDTVSSLSDRIRNKRDRAVAEARKAVRLEELLDLFDKNPEVARMLDLVEEVGR